MVSTPLDNSLNPVSFYPGRSALTIELSHFPIWSTHWPCLIIFWLRGSLTAPCMTDPIWFLSAHWPCLIISWLRDSLTAPCMTDPIWILSAHWPCPTPSDSLTSACMTDPIWLLSAHWPSPTPSDSPAGTWHSHHGSWQRWGNAGLRCRCEDELYEERPRPDSGDTPD